MGDGIYLRCTCVKEEEEEEEVLEEGGVWMGWTGWEDWNIWAGFFRVSGEAVCSVAGRSWFLLMICSASWVFPDWTDGGVKKQRHNQRKPLERR